MNATTVEALQLEMLAAGRQYYEASEGISDANPLMAGAMLRLKTKAWAEAERAMRAVTCPAPTAASRTLSAGIEDLLAESGPT